MGLKSLIIRGESPTTPCAVFSSTNRKDVESPFRNANTAQKKYQARKSSKRCVERLLPLSKLIEQNGKALDVYADASTIVPCPRWGMYELCSPDVSNALFAVQLEVCSGKFLPNPSSRHQCLQRLE